ncbi:MAG: hypothetical protein IKJ24_04110 [Clostridia bacterium]|nr:hypothetical protein [Clostridia bacterium]
MQQKIGYNTATFGRFEVLFFPDASGGADLHTAEEIDDNISFGGNIIGRKSHFCPFNRLSLGHCPMENIRKGFHCADAAYVASRVSNNKEPDRIRTERKRHNRLSVKLLIYPAFFKRHLWIIDIENNDGFVSLHSLYPASHWFECFKFICILNGGDLRVRVVPPAVSPYPQTQIHFNNACPVSSVEITCSFQCLHGDFFRIIGGM